MSKFATQWVSEIWCCYSRLTRQAMWIANQENGTMHHDYGLQNSIINQFWQNPRKITFQLDPPICQLSNQLQTFQFFRMYIVLSLSKIFISINSLYEKRKGNHQLQVYKRHNVEIQIFNQNSTQFTHQLPWKT